jgi:non-specific serine/threonine protein kinase
VPAARLLGAMAALRDDLAASHSAASQRRSTRVEATARSGFSAAAFQQAWDDGHARPLHEVVAFALDALSPAGAAAAPAPAARTRRSTSGAPEALTPREHEVARLLREGYPDRQIAATLAISPRTVGVHVQHVLAKLGVRSRWQIDSRVLAEG